MQTKIINNVKHVYLEAEDKWLPIVYEPLPGMQVTALKSQADYVLMGGARGPGKSLTALAAANRYGNVEGYTCLLLRRTHKRLQEMTARADKILPQLNWRKRENEYIHNTSGAIIRFGHCEYEKDKLNYIGHEYQRIIYDQLEEFTQSIFDEINTTCRSTIPGIKAQVFATANPGGIGHMFIKKLFFDRCSPKKAGPRIWNEEFKMYWQPEIASEPYMDEDGLTWHYIPGKVFENPYIIDNDRAYVLRLKRLPEEKRKGHLDGDWNVYIGQFFGEWDTDVHVVDEFKPPLSWRRCISLDYGSSAPFVAEFHCVNAETQELYTYREYSAKGKHLKYHAYEVARYISEEPHIDEIIFPHDMQRKSSRDDGDMSTLIEDFEMYLKEALLENYDQRKRIVFVKGVMGPNTRPMKWDKMKTALAEPWWYITKNCKNLIETLPNLIRDENNVDDIQSCDFDHWAEACAHAIVHVKRNKRKTQSGDAYGFGKGRIERLNIPQTHWMEW